MTDFYLSIHGRASDENIDKNVMTKAIKLIKELKKLEVTIDSGSISSGHFLGGSRNLVEAEEVQKEISVNKEVEE